MFSWSRFSALSAALIHRERKDMIWTVAIVSCLLVFLPMIYIALVRIYDCKALAADDLFGQRLYGGLIGFVTLVNVLRTSSQSLKEARDKASLSAFLSLPATALEKAVARYLIYGPGALLFTVAVCIACAEILRVLHPFAWEWRAPVNFLLWLLLMQGFCFIGATFFKVNPCLKAFAILVLFLAVVCGISTHAICGWNNFYGAVGMIGVSVFMSLWSGCNLDGGREVVRIILDVVIYLLCLAVYYHRIKELEIDEI